MNPAQHTLALKKIQQENEINITISEKYLVPA